MLTLFRGGHGLKDQFGRLFHLYSAPLDVDSSCLTECELCTEDKLVGYVTTNSRGDQEFVCADCVRVLKGDYAPTVLVQRFTRLVWTGEAWSERAELAKVFATQAEAESEHARFGYGRHVILVPRDNLGRELRRLKEE